MATSEPRRVLDPEAAHLASLRHLADFHGRDVLELGCGDGRLTAGIARDAARVVAFDTDADAVNRARRLLPAEFAGRVEFRIASGFGHRGPPEVVRYHRVLVVALMR